MFELAPNLKQYLIISILVNFSYDLGKIGGSLEKKSPQSGATNLIRFYIALNWGEMVFAIQKTNYRCSK